MTACSRPELKERRRKKKSLYRRIKHKLNEFAGQEKISCIVIAFLLAIIAGYYLLRHLLDLEVE